MSGGSRLWTFEQWWKVIPMRHKAIFLLAVSVPVGLALFIGPELSTEEQGNAQAQTPGKRFRETTAESAYTPSA